MESKENKNTLETQTAVSGQVELLVKPQPNTFYNADCMDYLPKCPDDYFDLAIVDPPYGIGEDGGADRRGKSKHKKKNWDKSPPSSDYFNELLRVSKNQIVFGGNYFADKLPVSRCWITWDKKLYNSDFSDVELIWASFDRGTKLYTLAKNGGSRTAVALTDIIHPCQKPVKLYKWILRDYAKAGDLILDTHVGSASSLIACKELGFDYVGFEIDKEYYEAASKRLDRAFRKYELEF